MFNLFNLFGRRKPKMSMTEAPASVTSRRGEMKVMNHTGHDLVTWNPDDPASVTAARTMFNDLRRQGYSAFRMDTISTNGVQRERHNSDNLIREFDPELGHIMMVPQRQGG